MPIFTPITTGTVGFGTATGAVAAQGYTYAIVFGGTWLARDTFGLDIVTASTTYKAGKGNITQIVPTAMLTLNDRVHIIAATAWYGSDNGDATQWEEQAPGAFMIETANQLETPEALSALAPYQGMIALFSPDTVQIWELDANPDNITLFQVLANIGCLAPLSAQPLGDLDIMFLHSSGIRSLRARVATDNAYVTDIGAPIDPFISGPQGVLAELAALGQGVSLSCATVEPNQNRYWLSFFELSEMYVLSYFPSNKIVAWSTYTPVDSSGAAFNPEKFVTLAGQVFFRASMIAGGSDQVYVYGGTDNITYDGIPATIQIPFYDEKKPGHKKYAQAFDIDLSNGPWTCYGSPDWVGETLQELGIFNEATFDDGHIPFSDTGTHFSFKAVAGNLTVPHPSGPPTVTSIIFYYELAEQPC